MALLLVMGLFVPAAYASETTDAAVQAVIDQLEAIDTLQQMQDNRSKYTVKYNHYDSNTTDTAIIENHETARAGYEAYVATMFAARIAAQQAYDALTAEQQAQINASLTAKLSNDLPTVFKAETGTVTPADDEYIYETVKVGTGYGYEVSNHMVSGDIPQTFVLVDTSDGETSWTPNGLYEYGECNYEVAYCCDVMTVLKYGTDYKRLNLEDSDYYGPESAKHIRAILQNAYPFVSMEEMKAGLKAGGLSSDFVDSLTRADLISAVQMAIWTYANVEDNGGEALGYFATVSVPKNDNIYFHAMHDYTNETWEWQPGKRQRSYDARAAYRVNNLAYYLCNLPGVEAEDDEIIISDVKVTRADLVEGSGDTFKVSMYIFLNDGGSDEDDLKVRITSYHTNEDGSTTQTATVSQAVNGRTKIELTVRAKADDTIRVEVEGTQKLPRGVYFYRPEPTEESGVRGASQNLVGVGEGVTPVHAETEFTFDGSEYETGLRIYKTESESGMPISDIPFTIYKANEGHSEIPTDDEIAKYMTEENKVGTITTDSTGYAELALEEGVYLVVEEHNADKVKAPVSPFYITVPMSEEQVMEDGSIGIVTKKIVAVYPKNEPVDTPEPPPIIPPVPDDVVGKFQILKYDEDDRNIVLSDVEFEVYRAATPEDTETKTIVCGGIQYAVVPVMKDGAVLTLTTGKDGYAVSPDLDCGVYFLVETKTKAGYNLLEEAVSVTVTGNTLNSVPLVEIPNKRGYILPETGGMGTVPFWMIGGIMTLCAFALLIGRKRMSEQR